jgi:2-amino-4-hydroxy-6-hydroxymethyldihydropteridine diphosphokinase
MSTQATHRAYLSLGSNLGDREAYLREAVARIDALPETRVTATSTILETPPWGKTDQPTFLNMALAIETALSPEDLLAALQCIEDVLGRKRVEHWGPRTVDIDLLLYDDEVRNTHRLHLPHPFLTRRRFVLEPLAQIAPDLVVLGKSVQEWLAAPSDSTAPFSAVKCTSTTSSLSVRLWTVPKTRTVSPSVKVRGSIGQIMIERVLLNLAMPLPTCIFGETAVTWTRQLVSESGSLNFVAALPVASVRSFAVQ